jgi:hypothetical protein
MGIALRIADVVAEASARIGWRSSSAAPLGTCSTG